jgi:hypothetical protein
LEALVLLEDDCELGLLFQPLLTSAMFFWRLLFSWRMTLSLAFCSSLFLPQPCSFRDLAPLEVGLELFFLIQPLTSAIFSSKPLLLEETFSLKSSSSLFYLYKVLLEALFLLQDEFELGPLFQPLLISAMSF